MPQVRTDASGFGLLLLGGTIFIFLTSVPGMVAAGYADTLDRMILSCVLGGLIFAAIFIAGHWVLRRSRSGSRAAYALLGALALIGAYASRLQFGDLMSIAEQGLVSYFAFLPAVVGAAFGFLYAFRAGWDRDDPAALEDVLTGTGPADPDVDEAFVEAGQAAYFSGPVRVRTSFPLVILASLIGGGVLFICRAVLHIGLELQMLTDRSATAVFGHLADMSLPLGMEMIFLTFTGIMPIAVCVIAGHFVGRGLKAKTPGAYFIIGLATPILFAVLSVGLLAGVALIITLPTAVSMACYRAFAGLEPEPVAEDIIASDPRALVGVNHVRRRFGRVIRTRS